MASKYYDYYSNFLADTPELPPAPVPEFSGNTWNILVDAKVVLPTLDGDKSIGVISKSGSEGSLLVTGKGHSITFEEADFTATLQTKAEGDTLICYANYAGKREVWVDNAEGGSAAVQDFVSIKDFGAQSVPPAGEGDGAPPFDSTDAIQSALDSGAKRIFVPVGRWLITKTVNVPPGVELFGEINKDGESEIFANEDWYGGNMIALDSDTILRKIFVNGATCCEYNISGGSSKNVLIQDCSAADSTMAEISFYGQGLIEGGNYDRSTNFGQNGASFEIGGNVKVKDLSLNSLLISGGSGGAQEAHDVNTRILIVENGAKLMFWRGSITDSVSSGYNGFRYGRFFGTKFGFLVADSPLMNSQGVELIGCVEE